MGTLSPSLPPVQNPDPRDPPRRHRRPRSLRVPRLRRAVPPCLVPLLRRAARRRGASPPGGARPPSSPPPAQRPLTKDEVQWLVFEARRLVKLAVVVGVRPEEALDVAQEAVKVALESWGTWPTDRDAPDLVLRRRWLSGFLFRVAAQHRYRDSRDHQGARGRGGAVVIASSTESAEGAAAARSMLRALERETTPERWRACVAWYVDGRRVSDIAAEEGVRAATIYNRLRLAREDFAAALRREQARGERPVSRRRSPPHR